MASAKRKGSQVFNADKDYLEITPLGSGSEVGRSCHIIRFKGKTIMLDCGIHPAHAGIGCLPFFDEVEASEIDLLLVSHFHLDHAAALPYFLKETDFKGRVFMTHPTKSVYKLILQDYIKVSSIANDNALYTDKDLLDSMDRIEVLNYHEVVHHKGIKFWCYNAGHVLGAAMFMIEIAGVKILYTGDYSRREDRHLMSAETPEVKPDILIVESTYGIQTLQPAIHREKRFTDFVYEVVKRGGRCLIPVFALGRAQELLLILDEFWDADPSLHGIPIYYASALAKKCMMVYQTYLNMMNKRIQQQSQVSNPFKFKHVMNLRGMGHFDDSGPCVVMASPGMLQSGLSRQLFELWCPDKRNGCIIPGYCVEGTLARKILSEPAQITTMMGQKVRLDMSVQYVSFSAHADYAETSLFVEELKPPHIVLVHGAAMEMGRLKMALQRKYTDGSIQVSAPKNCQPVEIEFRAQKIAKTVGSLANTPLVDGALLSGLIVRKDFNYHIMSASDLSTYTPLASTTVQQSITVPFRQTFECLKFFVGQMYQLEDEVVTTATSKAAAPVGGADNKGAGDGAGSSDQAGDVDGKAGDGVDDDGKAADGKATEAGGTGKGSEPVKQENGTAQEEQPAAKVSEAETEAKEAPVSETQTKPAEPVEEKPPQSSEEPAEGQPDAELVLNKGKPSLLVHGAVRITQTDKHSLLLEWKCNPVNDMISDSLVSLIMNVEANPGAARLVGVSNCKSTKQTHNKIGKSSVDIEWFLKQQFGRVERKSGKSDSGTLRLVCNDKVAMVNLNEMSVECKDEELKDRVTRALTRAGAALKPLRPYTTDHQEEAVDHAAALGSDIGGAPLKP